MTSEADATSGTSAGAGGIALEVLVAFGTAAVFLVSCVSIHVHPLERLGQISGIASLALRFVLFGIALIIALVMSTRRRGGTGFAMTSRLVCAAIAGLVTGTIAGGIMVALQGTPWGLNGTLGDVGALAKWASALHRGEPIPPLYPPLSIHTLHIYSDVMGLTPDLAIKHLQILGTAAFGPVAYLSWRLLLRPPWALALGVIATLPLIEPYKPYPNLVLVAFVPLAILFLETLRGIADSTATKIAQAAVGFGLAFGVLCLLYSGWFRWSAPGLLIATLLLFPWRTGRRKGIYLLVLTGAIFLLMIGQYVAGLLLDPAGPLQDTVVYFDVRVEPAYIAMWRNDLPGMVGVWPPIGELGGVGLFTAMLAAGLGLAVALRRKSTLVIGVGLMMASAWVLRFQLAHLLWETKLVQLYPRTSAQILYCLMILTGFAVYWLIQRISVDHPIRGHSGVIGAVCALLLLFGSAASATSDRYMPSETTPPSAGWLAYNAHRANWASKPKVYKSKSLTWIRRSAVLP
jgi:galactan 5-O-arabinofuranosyltransferase